MLQLPKPFVFVIAAVLVSASTFADAEETQSSADVIQHVQEVADAKLDFAKAAHARHAFKVQAIERLHGLGHSSFREKTIAQIELKNLSAQLASAEQFSGFVAKAAAASDTAGTNTSDHDSQDSETKTYVINVPGLATDPRMQLLSSVVLQKSHNKMHADLFDAVEESHEKVHSAPASSFRTDAWAELCERLSKLQDGSVSIRNEYAIALLDKRLADAESKLAVINNPTIHVYDSNAHFAFDDQEIDSIQGFITKMNSESDRLYYVTLRDAAESQADLIVEWNRRVEAAAKKGASPRSELSILKHLHASNQNQSLFAINTLKSMMGMDPNPGHSQATFVTTNQSSLHPQLGASNTQLTNLQEAAIDRVLAASHDIRSAQGELRHQSQAYEKLAALAQKDVYFLREVGRAQLEVQVAETSLENALLQHKLRVLENEYVTARINMDSPEHFIEPLAKIFALRSKSHVQQNLTQAKLRKEQWLVDGLTKLYQDGAASWKELIAAKVRRDELQASIKQLELQRENATLATKLLALPSVMASEIPKTAAVR